MPNRKRRRWHNRLGEAENAGREQIKESAGTIRAEIGQRVGGGLETIGELVGRTYGQWGGVFARDPTGWVLIGFGLGFGLGVLAALGTTAGKATSSRDR
jgi:hypothetical protein